jgi:hypothetical protein
MIEAVVARSWLGGFVWSSPADVDIVGRYKLTKLWW